MEQIKQNQVVKFEIVNEIYNKMSTTTAIVAGSDLGSGNVIVVGQVKTVTEKQKNSK